MNPRAIVWLMMLAGLGFLGAGCDTYSDGLLTHQLWTKWPDQHYQPSIEPDVRICQARGSEDVLVLYIEQREKTGATNSRAYYLLANELRVQDLKKPRFVRPTTAAGLTAIPVEQAGYINMAAPVWAELTPQRDGFRLFRNGAPTDWYHLPVYRDKWNAAEPFLLTPLTVTADTAVIGGVVGLIGLYCYAGAYAPYAEPCHH